MKQLVVLYDLQPKNSHLNSAATRQTTEPVSSGCPSLDTLCHTCHIGFKQNQGMFYAKKIGQNQGNICKIRAMSEKKNRIKLYSIYLKSQLLIVAIFIYTLNINYLNLTINIKSVEILSYHAIIIYI